MEEYKEFVVEDILTQIRKKEQTIFAICGKHGSGKKQIYKAISNEFKDLVFINTDEISLTTISLIKEVSILKDKLVIIDCFSMIQAQDISITCCLQKLIKISKKNNLKIIITLNTYDFFGTDVIHRQKLLESFHISFYNLNTLKPNNL
jgi:ABC-type antimicrobial peptide transport system ATPase subunit